MIIRPELQSLRGDDAPQRQAQQALIRAVGQWRREPPMAELVAEIEALDGGRAFPDCPALCALFDEGPGAARELAADLARQGAAWLSGAPLGHLPLRHSTDGVHSTLLIARTGGATLSLIALEGEGHARRPAPLTVDFGASEIWERVLAGEGRAQIVECISVMDDTAKLSRRDFALTPGAVLHRNARRQALIVRQATGCLVMLRLQRRDADAGPTREFRLADGRLVHQAAGNRRESREELMMALLGRMRRTEAAPLLAHIATGAGSAALRWQALRECLALDTLAGMQALCAIAGAPADPLVGPARALRARLVEAYPALGEVSEAMACPA